MNSKLPCQSRWLKVLFHASVHLKGRSPFPALTTALACPLVDDLRCCWQNQEAQPKDCHGLTWCMWKQQVYTCNSMQVGTILDALQYSPFLIFYASSRMNERNSSLEVFLRIWLWNIETWKKRTVNCANEKQLMNAQFDAIFDPPVITCDPKTGRTRLDDQPSNATGSQPWWVLFPKVGRSQLVGHYQGSDLNLIRR